MDALRQTPLALGRSLCENGFAALDQGDFAVAEHQFRTSLQYVPNHPIAMAGLGIARVHLGWAGEGLVLLARAAAAAPNEAFIAHAYGESLCRMERWREAVPPLERAIALRTGFVEAHTALGNALGALGRSNEAAAHYRTAIAINPNLPEPHNNLGLVLAAQARHDEALEQYRAALALRPDYGDARLNLGLSLLELKRPAEALAAFAALGSDPRAALGRGSALQGLGRMDEARAAFAEAARRNPDDPQALKAFADSRTLTPGDPAIAQMEALLPREFEPMARASLHFALFKAYDDTARFDEAARQLVTANRVWRPHVAYNEKAELNSLARIAELFTPELLQRPAVEADETAVFVVGMPRSGTSLVEQILASHPAVHGAGELGDLGLVATGGYTPDKRSLAKLINDPDALRTVAKEYLGRLHALAPEAVRIIDKMPANFMFIGLIRLALPGARIVHVRRNPLDTCFSCYAQLFRGALNYSYDQGELGRFYRAYDKLMAHWRAVLPAGAMLEIDYEALVGDFPSAARRLVAYCGLDWDEDCAAFHTNPRPVHTASAFQVRAPLYATSLNRAAPYQSHLGELKRALGI